MLRYGIVFAFAFALGASGLGLPACGAGGPQCSNTCRFSEDGDCDDGGPGSDFSVCELGTDCSDCGPRGVPEGPDDGGDDDDGNGAPPEPMGCLVDFTSTFTCEDGTRQVAEGQECITVSDLSECRQARTSETTCAGTCCTETEFFSHRLLQGDCGS